MDTHPGLPVTPSRIIGNTSRTLHPIGHALTDAATILHDMRDQLPPRGPLTDLYLDLVQTLTHVEATYHDANDALLAAYHELEHAERAKREGWTPRPLNGASR